MYGNPSYLSGLAERSPHYYQPVTPLAIQPYVSNVPLDAGDGVRPISYTQPSPIHYLDTPPPTGIYTTQKSVPVRTQRSFGSVYGQENGVNAGANAGANAGSNWYFGKNLKSFFQTLDPETKEQLKSQMAQSGAGLLSTALCNRLGIGCPAPEDFVNDPQTGGIVYQPPTWPYVVMGVMAVGLIGTVVWAVKAKE